MTPSWLIASIHLLALGIGLGAIYARMRALRGPLDGPGLQRVFTADNLWGVAAVLWIVTGLWRTFGTLDKGAAFYFGTPVFHTKLTLVALILLLEIWPMVTLIGWRRRSKGGGEIDRSKAPLLARISAIQVALVVATVFSATAVARGLFR